MSYISIRHMGHKFSNWMLNCMAYILKVNLYHIQILSNKGISVMLSLLKGHKFCKQIYQLDRNQNNWMQAHRIHKIQMNLCYRLLQSYKGKYYLMDCSINKQHKMINWRNSKSCNWIQGYILGNQKVEMCQLCIHLDKYICQK